MNNKAKLDAALDKFIGIEEDVEGQIDELDDSNQRETFDMVEYQPVQSKMPAEQRDSDLYDDYQYTRTILRGLIERGTSALEGSLMLAKESEHPRAFEVTSSLMKNISDMSKDLMALHKHVDETGSGGSSEPKSQTNIQNNYYDSKKEQKGVDDLLDDLPNDKKK